MKKLLAVTLALCLFAGETFPFCGFFVAKIDSKLFNKSSQVIVVRDGNRSTITMSNDYKGAAKDFAMVIPVPTVLKREDIKIANSKLFEKLDSYSGPRLVEYYDNDPCPQPVTICEGNGMMTYAWAGAASATVFNSIDAVADYSVTIEAKYQVDEYEILILSATESDGLKRWLNDNGYKIPGAAEDVLEPYIKSNMKFFVAKVDMEKLFTKKVDGFQELRPLQISFESDKFMLPIRLGMANANGAQDMIVYALTKKGRVETTNYRTVEVPSNEKIPLIVKKNFGTFYKDVFSKAYHKEDRKAVFLEYAWEVTPSWQGVKCDPCVGPPPIYADLSEAGAKWAANGGEKVFFTRLHVRYTRNHFPQDLQFQVTPNKERFQARYILTNPPSSTFECEAGQTYLKDLVIKRQKELLTLTKLTGWGDYGHLKYMNEYAALIKDDAPQHNAVPFIINFPSGPDKPMLLLLVLTIGVLFSMAVRQRRIKIAAS